MDHFAISLILCISMLLYDGSLAAPTVIDVTKYGAVGDGQSDDSGAFLKAWTDICEGPGGGSTLLVPAGKTFLLKSLKFQGPCNSPNVHIQVLGNIVAPNTTADWGVCEENSWILFSNVEGLIVDGSGEINGQGSLWWSKKPTQIIEASGAGACNCPTAVRFLACSNLQLKGLTHRDSPRNHISITACNGVTISDANIIAPELSPNTDGIDIAGSSHVNIQHSFIETGDDCVAINAGSSYINITQVACGPGHGISVGSLGGTSALETVEEVYVQNCNFTKTKNGARIKTWPGGNGFARKITFQQITLNAVQNPIVINQTYCDEKKPPQSCGTQPSNVKISDVTFDGFGGSSATENAIILQCSTIGCSNISLNQVNIVSATGGNVQAVCANVQGTSSSTTPSVPCLSPAT